MPFYDPEAELVKQAMVIHSAGKRFIRCLKHLKYPASVVRYFEAALELIGAVAGTIVKRRRWEKEE